jgi:hypothetical protein
LKYLLKQSEIFTHFIMQGNAKKGGAPPTDMELIRKGKEPAALGGKSSVSKRHLKKSNRRGEPEDDAEEAGSDQVITRLQAQPSIMKGGLLRDY